MARTISVAPMSGDQRSPPDPPTDGFYWRLEDYSNTFVEALQGCLRFAGVKIRQHASKPELVREVQKLALGRLNYKACATKELTKFIKDRGIKRPKDSMRREGLISALETADDTATFERFLDLPPELRERVALEYTADLVSRRYKDKDVSNFHPGYAVVRGVCVQTSDEMEEERRERNKEMVLRRPVQPPLTRTCRLIRQETLPIFYKTCTFDISLRYQEGRPGVRYHDRRTWGKHSSCEVAPADMAWFKAMGVENVQSLRNLRVWVRVERGRSWWPCNLGYQVRLGEEVKFLNYFSRVKAAEGRIARKFDKVLEKVAARERPGKFRMEDVFAMNSAVEDIFWDIWGKDPASVN